MRKPIRKTPALLLALISPYVAAQQPPATPPPQSVDLRYVGASTRIGVGYDSDNHLRGDAYWVFREDARSAWIGELWAASSSAGGAQISYNWQPADAGADAGVRKFFLAADQNQWRDRKVTLGGGYENSKWFATGYASAAITGGRQMQSATSVSTQTVTGSDNGRAYEQDIVTTTMTNQYERAYDYGVGARAGHFYERGLLRLEVGGDYEWGKSSASQATVSLGVEKFFAGSPVSVAVVGEAYWKRGDYESRSSDQRITAMVRYEFGGPAWRPARDYRMVQVDAPRAPAPVAAPAPVVVTAATAAPAQPRVEKRLVKTTATMSADAFFDFDKAVLRPDAKIALDGAVARLKDPGFEGNLRLTGHTCDIGTDAYNLKLSQRRADAVRSYLAAAGIPADRMLSEGLGKANPRHPNDAAGRPKNRRVDLEFVTYETREETVTLPPLAAAAPATAATPAKPAAPAAPQIEWRREEITTEPEWLRRALYNPAHHKQSVDVYTTQQMTSTAVAGEKRYANRAPVAVADAYTVNGDGSATLLDVLVNDNDPDGDALKIVSVTAPAHGTATISGGKVSYVSAPGYGGTDTFSYTIADPKGLTSTAAVTITVVQTNHPPVANNDFAIAHYNQPVTIDVLANDTDPDGDALTVISFTQPFNGTVKRGPGNTLVYLSKPDYIGYDYFDYVASDGKGGTSKASVTVFADP
ncbi:MAG: Ig-like domain-containing protein [Betaproteobacteria bacterium]